jgi:outer membrane protein OmpU
MNNSTRNLKMKKLLIASTALIATAGMANADIAITGHAAAGYHSDLADGGAVAPDSGVYSNAGIDFAMSGTTDNGITFASSVSADAGTEIDTGDFEFDGADGATLALGAVSVSGAFGTLTFDDNGIDNLYDDGLTAADVSYSTAIGAMSLTVALDANSAADGTSATAGYSAGAMSFTATASEVAAGTSASLAVSYVVSDNFTVTAETDQAAGAESVQTIGASTSLNGFSLAASSANDSTWDASVGYTVSGIALSYATDEASAWDATASMGLGGGATAHAGMNEADSVYAGVSLAF